MAFNKDRLSLMAVSGVKNAAGVAKGVGFYFYHAHGDTATGAAYFAPALSLGLKENDLVYVPDDVAGPVLGYISSAGTLTAVSVLAA